MPNIYRIGRRVFDHTGRLIATFESEFDATEYVAGVNDGDLRIERRAA